MAADVTLVPLSITLLHPIPLPHRTLFCLSLAPAPLISSTCLFYSPYFGSDSRSRIPLQVSRYPCFRSEVDLRESEDPQQRQHVGCLSSVDKVYKVRSISCLFSLGFQHFRSECSLAISEGLNTYIGWILGIRSACCADRSEILKSIFGSARGADGIEVLTVSRCLREVRRSGEGGASGWRYPGDSGHSLKGESVVRDRRNLVGSGYGYGSGGGSDGRYFSGSGGDYEVCGYQQDGRRSFSPESFRLGMFSVNEE